MGQQPWPIQPTKSKQDNFPVFQKINARTRHNFTQVLC